MKRQSIRNFKGPEAAIQAELINFLKLRDWLTLVTHGNLYQAGLPDLYICHLDYGARWVEVKQPVHYVFTRAQRSVFPALASKGIGIWILTAATDEEYLKLFAPANWWTFMHELKTISRPRPSVRNNEGYVPRYPTPGLTPKEKEKK